MVLLSRRNRLLMPKTLRLDCFGPVTERANSRITSWAYSPSIPDGFLLMLVACIPPTSECSYNQCGASAKYPPNGWNVWCLIQRKAERFIGTSNRRTNDEVIISDHRLCADLGPNLLRLNTCDSLIHFFLTP